MSNYHDHIDADGTPCTDKRCPDGVEPRSVDPRGPMRQEAAAMLREIAKAMRDKYDAAYIERRAAELEQLFSNDVTNRE